MLPGLDRIWWGSWLDLLGDWCGGVSLMIGKQGFREGNIACAFVFFVCFQSVGPKMWWRKKGVIEEGNGG